MNDPGSRDVVRRLGFLGIASFFAICSGLGAGTAWSQDRGIPAETRIIDLGWDVRLVVDRNTSPEITAAVREVVETVRALIPIGPVTIELSVGDGVLPFIGIGGSTAPDSAGAVVSLTYDPGNPNFTLDHLRRGLAHELHHAGRLGMPEWRLTLLELIVMEGLADHFTLEVFGGEVPRWSQSLSDDELDTYVDLVEPISRIEYEEWTSEFNDEVYVPWFFGRPEGDRIPPWAGYSIGWRIVGNFLAAHPESAASTLVHAPAARIAAATPELNPRAR